MFLIMYLSILYISLIGDCNDIADSNNSFKLMYMTMIKIKQDYCVKIEISHTLLINL